MSIRKSPNPSVSEEVFPNRGQGIQAAVEEKLARLEKGWLARECAKLDPLFEKALADEGLSDELAQVIEGLNEIIGGP